MQHEFKVGDMVESIRTGGEHCILCIKDGFAFVETARGQPSVIRVENLIPANSERGDFDEQVIKDLEGSWSVGPRAVAQKLYDAGYRKQSTDSEWIEWHGGECPVGRGVYMDIKWDDGSIDMRKKGRSFRWDCESNVMNIVAYRISKSK